MNQERYAKLKKDRPFLRHRREQRREAQAVREWNKLQALHHRRERRAYEARGKIIPSVVGAAVTSILLAQREEQAKQRQWAMFHTLWAMNRARGAK